jgi:enoyl-[acyl-carrier protein] reductase I
MSDIEGAGLLQGKRGLVVGVANERSLAWGIAKRAAAAGAQLAFTYQGEALLKRVTPLAESVGSQTIVPMDVTDEGQVDRAIAQVGEALGRLDFLVHSIAYADREDLKGRTVDTSRDGFLKAMEISAYSLLLLARKAEPLMSDGGSILALTYYGSEKVVPNYNVMGIAKAALEASVRYLAADLGPRGIRVNAISAGPIRTLSASGVKDFNKMVDHIAEVAPLRRNVTAEEVGDACLFLAGRHSRGITGTTMFVDAGFHIIGV